MEKKKQEIQKMRKKVIKHIKADGFQFKLLCDENNIA